MRDIAKRYDFKHKSYSEDVMKQILLSVTSIPSDMGGYPSFQIAHNDSYLPMDLLAKAFNAHYGNHNLPVLIHSARTEKGKCSLLSISQNSVTTYDIKSFRPLMYLSEVKDFMPKYLEAFTDHLITAETIYGSLKETLTLQYYSEKGASNQGILKAADLENDSSIIQTYNPYKIKPAQSFPERAPFLKAFVEIRLKD